MSSLSLDRRDASNARRPIRFVVFAVAILVGIGGLSARLFYLQVLNSGRYATLAQGNRTVQSALPSARGLIYDRDRLPLVANVPTYSVKIRPADLPLSRRADVVAVWKVIRERGEWRPGKHMTRQPHRLT